MNKPTALTLNFLEKVMTEEVLEIQRNLAYGPALWKVKEAFCSVLSLAGVTYTSYKIFSQPDITIAPALTIAFAADLLSGTVDGDEWQERQIERLRILKSSLEAIDGDALISFDK